jgi:hypothetical protein
MVCWIVWRRISAFQNRNRDYTQIKKALGISEGFYLPIASGLVPKRHEVRQRKRGIVCLFQFRIDLPHIRARG